MGKPENRSLTQEIRGTDESTLARDSSVPFMHRDPNDLRSMIPFRLLISQRNPPLASPDKVEFQILPCQFVASPVRLLHTKHISFMHV